MKLPGKISKGDVVVLPFPFSDLTGQKKRPALVLTPPDGDDVVLCQITSVSRNDEHSIPLKRSDFSSGSLPVDSFIRPNKIFTADTTIIVYPTGTINKKVSDMVSAELRKILDL